MAAPKGDLELRLVDGAIQLIGPPEGSRILRYESKATFRLVRIRMAESLLNQAKAALEAWQHSVDQPIVQDALASFAAGNYVACFRSGELSPKLDAKTVFREKPEALERHKDWIEFRDKRYHHVSSVGRNFGYAAIFTPDDEFFNGYVLSLDSSVGHNQPWLQLLFQLVHEVLSFLDEAAEKAWQKIQLEVNGLSKCQIDKLVPFNLDRPDF